MNTDRKIVRKLKRQSLCRLGLGFLPQAFLICVLILGLAPCSARSQPLLVLGTDGAAPGHAVSLPLGLLNANNLAGLQFEFIFDPRTVNSHDVALIPVEPGILADGALVSSNRFRAVLVSTNRLPLPNGLLANLTLVISTNSLNGRWRVPLRMVPSSSIVGTTTNGVCVPQVSLQDGQLLVGDAFGFTADGGRIQFRAVDGLDYLFQASTNLLTWSNLGHSIGLNELTVWIDAAAGTFPQRFYRAQTP